MPPFLVSVPVKVLRCLLWVGLALCTVAAVACLGVRYWVLPRVDQWRPQIERYASDALGSQIRIDGIAADWRGLNPRLHLNTVRIYDTGKSDPVLTLPSVDAVMAWRSLLRLAPRLLSLRIDGADLTVRRDASGLLWVAGLSFDPAAASSSGGSPVLSWLSQQRQLAFSNTTLRWVDEQRQAPELVLDHLDLALSNGVLAHRFALRAHTPAALAAGITVNGEINRRLFATDLSNPSSWNGQLYVQLDDAEPLAWSPWLPVPDVQGRVAARAWLRVERGALRDVTLDAVLRGLNLPLPGQAGRLAMQQAHVRVEGVPGDLVSLPAAALPLPLVHSSAGQGMEVHAELQGLEAVLPGVFEAPALQADEIQIDGSLQHPPREPVSLELRQLRVRNADLDLDMRGRWRDEGAGGAGTADLQGTLARAAMTAIHRYLPSSVNAEARAWLASSILGGEILDATVLLKGELADFPFNRPGSTGQFRVAGNYHGARLDYAPARADAKGWPVLDNLAGHFVVDRAGLALDSAGGLAQTGPGLNVALHDLHASIPDMDEEAQLDVQGNSSGAASAYLAIAGNSPLGALLDGALDQAEGDGDWQVPIKLHVPLDHVADMHVDGRIAFQGGAFRLAPQMPRMSDLHGGLVFSEHGLQADGLRFTFLGGPVRVSGKLGAGESLDFLGSFDTAALDEVGRLPAWQRFSGKAAYQGRLSYAKGGDLDVSIKSDLMGLAIGLPAPLGKAAQATLPLSLRWGPAPNSTSSRGRAKRWLSGSLGENINLVLEHDPAERGAPYFARGALAVGRQATLPARGLVLAGTVDTLDSDAWEEVRKTFSAAPPKGKAPASAKPAPPILPGLDSVSLTVGHLVVAGQEFEGITFFAQQPAAGQWRVVVDSRQAVGTLEWTEASGAVAGKVVARFDRLAVGKPGDADKNEADGAKESELSDIPAIDLQAKKFILYGHDVGSLAVVGTNMERGKLWRLDTLRIANESAVLDATGSWRLDGPDRGLSVTPKLDIKNLGGLLDRLDQHSVSGGQGTVEGKLFWRNMPWHHDKADIEGSMHMSLENGRFVHMSSRTARLLELLSLQSMSRLTSLSVNPSGLLKEGFAFDSVTGDLRLAHGVANIDGYKVSGPAAAIALEGSTNIVSEIWDLHAVVVPNIDASGAALATVLVNPVLGIGAFIGQWLLKQPLARAMTVEYHVHGTWDDPKVDEVETKAPAAQSKEPAAETAPAAEH